MNDPLRVRVCDALDAVALPAFPRDAVHARASTLTTRSAARDSGSGRARRPAIALAVVVLALAASGLIATAVTPVFPDAVVRAFRRLGVDVRTLVPMESRTVSLDEARRSVDFSLVVPPGVRVVRTLIAVARAAHRRTVVSLVLQYDGRSQLELDEHRALPGRGRPSTIAHRIDANGRIRPETNVVWRIGETDLVISTYDARSLAFAKHVRALTLAGAPRSSRATDSL